MARPFRESSEDMQAGSGADARDFDGRQRLTVTRSLAVIFPAAELLDHDLLVFELAHDLGFDLGAGDRRGAELRVPFASHKQDLFERQSRVGFAGAEIHDDLIANSHAILVASVFENRVHHQSPGP